MTYSEALNSLVHPHVVSLHLSDRDLIDIHHSFASLPTAVVVVRLVPLLVLKTLLIIFNFVLRGYLTKLYELVDFGACRR